MTPAPIPGRPARDLAELLTLAAGDRVRFAGRPATILAARPIRSLFDTFTPDQTPVALELVYDTDDTPVEIVLFPDALDRLEILPPPRVYTQETPA